MDNRLRRFQRARTLVLGAATLPLLWLAGPMHAQSTATQTGQAVPGDDITRRDLARFDQFLDSHHEIADQLRRTPSLIDNPQFLQAHPELNAYLQDHPSVKQEISARPDTFMRLEDVYGRDAGLRDRDAGGQDRDAGRSNPMNQDRDASRGNTMNQDRDANRGNTMNQDRDAGRGDAASFDRFLNEHREIGEQVRKDPSLLDNRKFVENHPALQTYLRDNPGVRDQLRQDPNAFMRQGDFDNRNLNMGDRDAGRQDRDAYRGNAMSQDRDADRRDAANFGRFLDEHREIGEQVRKDPSLLDNRKFVDSHPALQTYLQDNPGIREQLRQNPNAFTQQADLNNRDMGMRNRDAMHDHMADFGGFLGSHSDVQKDLSKDPSVVKDHHYVQNHAELNAYLNAHPDVRNELMANPQSFVRGAQQYNNGSATGTAGGAGVSGRGAGTTGTSVAPSATGTSTGTSMNPTATTHVTKPNQ